MASTAETPQEVPPVTYKLSELRIEEQRDNSTYESKFAPEASEDTSHFDPEEGNHGPRYNTPLAIQLGQLLTNLDSVLGKIVNEKERTKHPKQRILKIMARQL